MPDVEETYLIAAGGTGGHIFPGIALAREIESSRPSARVVFVGTGFGLERRLVTAAGYALEFVAASGFAGKRLPARLASLARLPAGVFAARRLIRRLRPRAVAGVGGYVSVPVLLAARSLGVPTVIHESNATPGVANRLLARFASRTAVGLEAARGRFPSAVVTGTPVRPEFLAVSPRDPSAVTRRLLVFGGSQGSRVLNRVVAQAAPALVDERLEVVHQTGEAHLESTRRLYGTVPEGWRLEAFLPRLWEEMGRADLVVSRAGAMTLAELAAAGRASLLIPFGSATHGHQLANAVAFAAGGAAVAIEEDLLTAALFARALVELFEDPARLAAMGASARSLARPDAAARLARLLFDAAEERGRRPR